MRQLMSAVAAAVVLMAFILGSGGSAHAQDAVAQFYKGKQLKLYIASTPGGGYDSYGRLLGQYIGKYIPGNPTIVPQNMPGAGGNRLAAYLYNVAPKDGTEFGIIFPGAVLDPLIGTQQVQDDPSKLIYMGSANVETFVCIMRSDAPVKTYEDVLKTQVTLAASAAGGSTVDMPALENNLLGAQWKVVRGYPGSREIALAVEQGEAQGNCGVGVSSVEIEHPDWRTSGKYRLIAQETNKGHPLLESLHIPLTYSFAKTDEQRAVMELAYSQEVFGRPFVMPPSVPKERVDALRKAFMEALKDKDLLAQAKKQRLDIEPISGEDVQKLVTKVYGMPPAVVAKAKEALVYKDK
jgi:tripartite-type tricarboxylate transporter receptor subunit TctC